MPNFKPKTNKNIKVDKKTIETLDNKHNEMLNTFHDEENISSVGDKVKIKETKPISKNKSWELVEVIKKFEGASE